LVRHGRAQGRSNADGLTEKNMADDDAQTAGDGTTEPQQNDQDSDPRTQRDGTDQDQQREPDRKDDNKTFTQADVERLLADRLSRERKKFADYDGLKKKAIEFDKLQDAQKSEVEKLNDQLATAQVELQGFRVAEIRRTAADAAGLPAKYAKYITAADEAEALEQAKELAKDIKTPEPKPADLKQGTRPHTPAQQSRDELLRGLAGYGR
jgi:glutamate synthase domain-containing protein 3